MSVNQKIDKQSTLLVSIIISLGFFLRVYNLNKYNFWFDESLSLIIAKFIPLRTYIFEYAKFSPDSELFDILLYLWMHWVRDEALFRFLPLIFGILSIITVYFIGSRLFNKKVGLISTFLLAISPFHIYYSQELRSYTLFLFLGVLSFYFLIKVLTENKSSLWAGFILSNIFCLYAHKTALFLLLTENIYFLFFNSRKRLLLKWLISQVIILLLGAHFFSNMIHLIKLPISSVACFVPKPSVQKVIDTFNVFHLGYYGTNELYFSGFLIFFPIFLFGVWHVVKEKNKVYLLFYWIFIPIITGLLISIALKQGSIYISRFFIYILPAYLILVANGLRSIKDKRLFLLFLSLIVAATSAALHNYYNYNCSYSNVPRFMEIPVKKEYKSAANYIRRGFQDFDIVVHNSRSTVYPFLYYHNNEIKEMWVFCRKKSKEDELWSVMMEQIYSRCPSFFAELNVMNQFKVMDIRKVVDNYKRIWLVDSAWHSFYKDQEGAGVRKWLDKNLRLLKEAHFKGIDIYLYESDMHRMRSHKIGNSLAFGSAKRNE